MSNTPYTGNTQFGLSSKVTTTMNSGVTSLDTGIITDIVNILTAKYTTEQLINNNNLNINIGTHITTTGYSSPSDGGEATWVKLSDTTTSSQTPSDLVNIRFSDGSGNLWELVPNDNTNAKSCGAKFDYDPVANTGTDDTAALLAYNNGIVGQTLATNNNTYRIARYPPGYALLTGSIISVDVGLYSGVSFIGSGKFLTRFYLRTLSDVNIFNFRYNVVESQSVGASIAAGQTTITSIASTANFQVGDYLQLQDESQPNNNNFTGDQAGYAGEWIKVRSVDSGTQISTVGNIELDYNAVFTTIYKLQLIDDITVSDIGFFGDQNSGGNNVAGLGARYVTNLTINRCHFENFEKEGIVINGVAFFNSDDCSFKDLGPAAPGYGYHLRFGCWKVIIRGATSENTRHIITGGVASSVPNWENAHILMADCKASECQFAAFDTHPGGGRHWTFDSCEAFNEAYNTVGDNPADTFGFQIRSRFTTIYNCLATNFTIGMFIVNGSDCTINGGSITDCDTSIRIQDSPRAQILGSIRIEQFEQEPTNIINVQKPSTELASMPGIILNANITYNGTTSGEALNYLNWEDDYIIKREKLFFPNVTNMTTTVPHYALYGGLAIDGASSIQDENISRMLAADTLPGGTIVDGQVYLTAINIENGRLVSRLAINIAVAATDQSNRFLGVYDKDLNLLGTTADGGATEDPTGINIIDLSTAFNTAYTGLYYIAILQALNSGSTFQLRGSSVDGSFTAQSPEITGRSSTGQTSLPNPAAAITASPGDIPWVAYG